MARVLEVRGRNATLERLVVVSTQCQCIMAGAGQTTLRRVIAQDRSERGVGGLLICRNKDVRLRWCLMVGGSVYVERGCLSAKESIIALYATTEARLENVVAFGEYLGRSSVRSCTIPAYLKLNSGPNAVVDSIVSRIAVTSDPAKLPTTIERCDVYDSAPFWENAKPGKGCFSADPQFRDPASLDYRLRPNSPCRKRASDGGDLGCRYTREMLEVLAKALELRKKGIIKF